MISVEQYSEDKRNIWDNFVKNSRTPMFMFERNFMEYHKDRFQDNSLMFYENDELVAILPLTKHDTVLKSHGGLTYGGFIINTEVKQNKMLEIFNSLKEYMIKYNFKELIYKQIPFIYHTLFFEEDEYSLFINNANILKIEPSTMIYLNNILKMPKGRKAQISRAKREGVVIKESKDFDTFIKMENEILTTLHNTHAVHTAGELELLQSKFPNEIKLYIAEYQGNMIAGGLLFIYPNVVHTQYLASNDISREIGGLDLLIKTLIDKFSNDKMYFDFGISTENDGKLLNEGLIKQKESFGGRTICYKTWELSVQ